LKRNWCNYNTSSMVYLADDDLDDLEILQEALNSHSYKGPVATVPNGQVLLDKLIHKSDQRPDVIILDLNMPIKDGFQTLKEIRTTPDFQNIPVIILTASSRKEDQIKCFELGCNLYFTKPSSMDAYAELTGIVKKLVGAAQIN
jgi:CheY-like chemotaxis protein